MSLYPSLFCYSVQRQVKSTLNDYRYQCLESIKLLKYSKYRQIMNKTDIMTHFKLSMNNQSHFLLSQRKIKDLICVTHEYIVTISEGGCAMYFHLDDDKNYGFINRNRIEFISNIFWNLINDTLCINYCLFDDSSSRTRLWKDRNRLYSRVLPLRYLKEKQMHRWFPVFDSENLRHPGFLEFDSVNQVILTFSAPFNRYRLWKMESYEVMMTFDKKWMLKELRLSPGALLLIDERCLNTTYIQLHTFSFKNETFSKKLRCPVKANHSIDFIELLGSIFAIKQPKIALQMFNINTNESFHIEETSSLSSQHFIFLYQKRFMLLMLDIQIIVREFSGQIVTRINHSCLFQDSMLYCPAAIYLPKEQDLLIVYDKNAIIRIIDLIRGKCMIQIDIRKILSNQPEQEQNVVDTYIPESEKLVMFAYNSFRRELYLINRNAELRTWTL